MPTEADDPLARRRDALQRIVYGTPDPSDAAIVELTAVEAEFVARRAVAGTDGRAPTTAERGRGPDSPSEVVVEPPPPTSSGRRMFARWVVGASLAAMLAAVVLLIAPVRAALAPPRGLDVFERPATAEEEQLTADVVADAGLQPTPSSTVRRLERRLGYEFWAYRDDDRVCLLSRREYWFPWVHECATVEEFAEAGLTRVILAAELSDSVRPSGVTPDELVVATWRPTSIELEWSVIRARDAERQA